MPDFGSATFSQTDSSNNSGTMPSWSGSAAPSTLDDAGRALQGAATREWNWRSYTLTATGTADAKVLSYSVAPAAYYNGQRFAFIANTTNTASATLNVNSLGAKSIKKDVSGTLTNLSASDMVSGMFVEVSYNTANDCFVWVNQTTANYFTSIELGNASDTTITRSAAGVLAVEGGVIPKENRANTFSSDQMFNGNVGIGTTTPTSKLLVSSTSGDAPNGLSGKCVARLQSTQTAAVGVGPSLLFEGQTNNSTANYAFAGIQGFKASATAADYTGSLAFFTQNAGGGSALDEKMRIDGISGHVGIGVTPSARLHVSSGAADEVARFEGTGSPFISLYDSGVRDFYIQDLAATVSLVGETSKAVTISTNNIERMRIDAAGAVTIGGSPVIAASGTAAQGDVLYHNGTAWTRLAAGTSGQFLKTNGAGANPAWASQTVGGVTLLGTITTTSLATQSLTGLNLTGYKFLRAVFNGVSTAASTWDISFCGGLVVNSAVNTNAYSGTVDVDLASSVVTSVIGVGGGAVAQARAEIGTVTNASTTVSVSMGGSSFDAGSIRVYGIA